MTTNDGKDEFIEFMLRRENFDAALEIYGRFSQVVSRLQSRFWSRLKQRLEEILAQSPKEFNRWECDLVEGDPGANYFSIYLLPKASSTAKLYCCPRLQQTIPSYNFQLFYGVSWNEQVTPEPRTPEYEALKRKVRDELKLTNTGSGWWVGGKYLTECITKPETLRQLATDDSLERLQADQLFALFKDTRELLEKLNRALLKK